jgi:hypothetical protein
MAQFIGEIDRVLAVAWADDETVMVKIGVILYSRHSWSIRYKKLGYKIEPKSVSVVDATAAADVKRVVDRLWAVEQTRHHDFALNHTQRRMLNAFLGDAANFRGSTFVRAAEFLDGKRETLDIAATSDWFNTDANAARVKALRVTPVAYARALLATDTIDAAVAAAAPSIPDRA